MNFNNNQQRIINAKENKIVVLAAAASGKTTVLVERLKWLLNEGVNPEGIVAITFTNAAAENIKERVGLIAHGMFIGTVHAYANYLLLSRGIDTTKYLEEEDFNHLFEMIKQNPECIRPVEHLLLDEAQDSTQDQFEFFLEMIRPTNYFFVGDHKQSIYRWAGAQPEFLIRLMHSTEVTTYPLNENYRNSRNILSYAKGVIKGAGYNYSDNSIPKRAEEGIVKTINYVPERIIQDLSKVTNYGDWFILCRLNADVDRICDLCDVYDVPYDTFKRADMSNKALNQCLRNNTVKVLTIHAAKGLEAKNVIVVPGFKPLRDVEEFCVYYVAYTRARDLLIITTRKQTTKKKVRVEQWE